MTRVVFLSIFVLWGVWGRAATEVSQSPQRVFAQSFASPRVEMLLDASPLRGARPGFYPEWYRTLMTKVLGKIPDSMPKTYSAGCEPDVLEAAIAQAPSGAARAQQIDEHFQKCHDEWDTGTRGSWWHTFHLLRTELELQQHPFFQPVMLNLPGGTRLKALLALKGDNKKRPFVILRLGIFSNVEEFRPERFLLMQMFEQGPANVLVLESSSGADFVANNAGLVLGGPEEGLQNLQVARLLRDPAEPLSKLVNGLHLAGASLGGHSLFQTAALEAYQKNKKPWIDSYFGLCPVVHLKETLHRPIRPGVEGTLVDMWIAGRLAGLRDRISFLAEAGFGTWWKLQPFFWPEALRFAEAVYPTQQGLREGLRIPPAYDSPLWEAAEPWSWWSKARSPFVVVATKEDDVVPFDLNSARLPADLGQQSADVGVAVLSEGFHCSLTSAYDWNVVSALVNGSVLGASATSTNRENFEMDLGEIFTPTDLKGLRALNYEITWPAGGESVLLKIHASAGGKIADFSATLPRNEFGFTFLNPGESITEVEKRMLERWLHRNLRVELQATKKGSRARLSWPQAALR